MTRSSILILSVAAVALATAFIGQLQTPRLGYIDSSALIEQYPRAVAVRAELQATVGEWEANATTLRAELDTLGTRLVQDDLPSRERAALRDSVESKRQELVRYSRAVSERAAALEAEKMQPVFDEINARLERFGKAEGYDLIFGTLAGGSVLFAQDAADLTDDFLAYAERL